MLPVILNNQDLKTVEERWTLDDLGSFLYSRAEHNAREAKEYEALKTEAEARRR